MFGYMKMAMVVIMISGLAGAGLYVMKLQKDNAILKANQVKNLNISKYQISWHLNHREAGGVAYILNWPLFHEPAKLYEVIEPGLPVPVARFPVPVKEIMDWLQARAA